MNYSSAAQNILFEFKQGMNVSIYQCHFNTSDGNTARPKCHFSSGSNFIKISCKLFSSTISLQLTFIYVAATLLLRRQGLWDFIICMSIKGYLLNIEFAVISRLDILLWVVCSLVNSVR